MKHCILIIFLFFVLQYGSSQCDHPDYMGLMEFYNAMNGPNWLNNDGWKEGNEGTSCNPCNWEHITCENNRVVEIQISDITLTGDIPDINLPELKYLELNGGNITNVIPDFTHLGKLEFLRFAACNIDKPIPNFSQLPNLTYINFGVNQIPGSVPNFNKLPKLKVLNLVNNELSDTIPDFQHLDQLEELTLSFNNLEGGIPDFKNLENLKHLNLHSNNLSGSIPDFSNLPLLKYLRINGNQMTGTIPRFTHLDSIFYLDLSNNLLSGQLPELPVMQILQILGLANNNLEGSIPDYSVSLPNLRQLNIRSNNLSGCIPSFVCNSNTVFAEDNYMLPFGGDIQAFCAATSGSGEQIGLACGGDLYFNTGTIQDDCSCLIDFCESNHPDFEALMDIFNATNGENWTNNNGWLQASKGVSCDPCADLPVYGKWFGISCDNMGRIIGLDLDGIDDGNLATLSGNNLFGSLPKLNLPFLRTLILTGNDLTGPLPDLQDFTLLEKVGLSFNDFSGPLPDLSNSRILEEFRASYNRFIGPIPDLSSFPELSTFVVSNNLLEKCFPQESCSITTYSSLDNPAMPWQGDQNKYCQGISELGAPCITTAGSNGFIDQDCNCVLNTSSQILINHDIKIIPNPVINELMIKSTNEFIKYQILDAQGVLIQSGEVLKSSFPVEHLSSGVYFILLSDKNERRIVERFIKN